MKNKSIKSLFFVILLLIISPVMSLADTEISLKDVPLSIDKAVQIAFEKSRALKQAMIDYETSDKKLEETKSQFGFDLKLSGNYQRVEDSSSLSMASILYMPQDISGYFATTSLTMPGVPIYTAAPTPTIQMNEFKLNKVWQHSADAELTKPLFLFGKKRDAIQASRLQKKSSSLDVEIEKLELTKSVKQGFYNLLLMMEVVKVQEEAVNQADSHLNAAKTRFEVGVSPKFDVIMAEVEVATAREELTTAQKGLELTRMAFNNLIGLPVSMKTRISDKGAYELINLKPIDFYLQIAFENRVEINQIEYAKDMALASSRLSRLRPTIAFSGTYNIEQRGSGFGSENSWRAILAGEIPIFDNGTSKAQIAQARKLHEKLELNMVDLKEGIELQVEQAYLSLLEASQRIDTSAAVLKSAEEAYRMADAGFKEGVTANIDLIDAEHGLTQAKLNRANANFDYEIQKAGLARACGLDSLSNVK